MGGFRETSLLDRFREVGAGGLRLPRFATPTIGRHNRRIGEWMLHAAQRLRALVRADEIWLVVLAAVLGLFAGLSVVAMSGVTQAMHRVLFALGPYRAAVRPGGRDGVAGRAGAQRRRAADGPQWRWRSPAGGPAGRSTRSRRTRSTAAGCR